MQRSATTFGVSWRRYAPLGLIAVLAAALLMLSPADAGAAAAKSTVCHYSAETDTYARIDIADRAMVAHIAHGDGLPGGLVPTMSGFEFDSSCSPVIPICISVDGVNILQVGTATCSTNKTIGTKPNTATAIGPMANATATDGDNLTATANGTSARALVSSGYNLTATANGASAYAEACCGTDNTATADGTNSYARTCCGSRNTATATGNAAHAFACCGTDNTATATGDSARAESTSGVGNSATADGNAANAYACCGNDNTATATGDSAGARAVFGDRNSATATSGQYACAGGNINIVANDIVAVNSDLCLVA